jgi:hypothetical protein
VAPAAAQVVEVMEHKAVVVASPGLEAMAALAALVPR